MIARKSALLTALAAAMLAAALWSAAAQAASPAWRITVSSQPTNFTPNTPNAGLGGDVPGAGLPEYVVIATNVGGAPTSGAPYSITDTLPSGITEHGSGNQTVTQTQAQVAQTGDDQTILQPGRSVSWLIHVDVGALDEGSTAINQVTVSGGGAASASAQSTTTIGSDPPSFDFLPDGDGLGITDAGGLPVTQAGSHPYQVSFSFGFPTVGTGNLQAAGELNGTGGLRDLQFSLPKGMVVDPSATPIRCTEAQLESDSSGSGGCPDASQIGLVAIDTTPYGDYDLLPFMSAVYNMIPPPGSAAQFGFDAANVNIYVHVDGGVHAGDYSLDATSNEVLARFGDPVAGIQTQLWGDPSAAAHDTARGQCLQDGTGTALCPVPRQDTPFLTMPSECRSSLELKAEADSWVNPGDFHSADIPATDSSGAATGIAGCNSLDFAPSLKARPSTNAADSPSGLSVDLHIPQSNSLGSLATAHLRKASVTLPQGLVLNPASANGLAGCSSAQAGIDPGTGIADGQEPSCPDASRIGTVEVDTSLLDHPLPGSVYVAAPHDNPFDSLLAIYVVLDDQPQSNVLVKLAGEVSADPGTGQLTATFADNPQLPFTHFKLEFKSGAHGVLRTPPTCGNYSTTSQMTPWSAPDSGPPATPHDDYSISQGPNGSACSSTQASEPNAPGFDAGSVNPLAGTYAPFVVRLSRADGSQQFSSVTLTPPPGLLGKLAGTPACSDAALDAATHKTGAQESANPSCPAASQVGTVEVAAGAGPSPYYATGKAYLAGPYKGAPLSMAIITPATAGPYDLGTVVVRTALRLDPSTAQITATSDPIPQILQGIPLDVRSASIRLDKPNFTLNGTSCNEMAVTGSLLSSLGQSASLSQRFQLAECSSLGFKPKLALSLKGGTKRNGHPALTSVLIPRAGDANLAKAAVTLPAGMQLDQSHIQAPCTRPQFAAGQCPAASVIGTAVASSPLLDHQLSGPVYLRTGNNPLPDLVLALHGPDSQPIEIDVVGKIDTVNARLRTTFETVPDAPVSKAVIQLAGASKGLLVNNTSLCKQVNRATVLLDGQNGKTADSTPKVGVKCPKPRKPKHHKRNHRRHHQRHGAR